MGDTRKCSCGNRFLVLLSEMSDDVSMIAEPSEPPTAWCPGCQAIWQHEDGKWRREIGSTTLVSLRHLSNKV